MADNRSKALQKPTNPKKSVKQNRSFIRLRIVTFYTIIFTTAFKIVQIVASFNENHITANPPEKRTLYGGGLASSLSPSYRAPRAYFSSSPQPSLRHKDASAEETGLDRKSC